MSKKTEAKSKNRKIGASVRSSELVRHRSKIAPDTIDLMEELRSRGWLVSVRCIPDGKAWLREFSEDVFVEVSRKRWSCHAEWLGADPWRNSQTASAEHPYKAVVAVFHAISDDDVRRDRSLSRS